MTNTTRARSTALAAAAALLLLSAATAEAARKDVSPAPAAEQRAGRAAMIAGETFARCEAQRNLLELCDVIGPRQTGTEGARRARAWAAGLMKRHGLRNVHEEPYEFPGWIRGAFSCEAVPPSRFPLHALSLGNSCSTPPEGVEAEVVDALHGDPSELDRLGEALRGRWALVIDEVMPGGRWLHRSEIMREVWKRGAAGMLFQTTEPGELPITGTCWQGGASPVPGLGVSREDGEWIRRRLAAGERVVVRVAMTNEARPLTCANVVGEIPGAGPDFVVLGAHLDSWDLSPGAVDNGTGVVVALEAARALARSGLRPAATIRVVLFTGEESGLYGSEAYVRAHEAEIARCRAMMNCDMIGVPVGVRVMGHEEAKPFYEELIRSLPAFNLAAGVSTRPGIHGDQQAFLLAGVPVVNPSSRLDEASVRWYHTAADTYEKAALGPLAGAAAFTAILAMETAWPEARPVAALDAEGVRRLVHEYKLEDALEAWTPAPARR